MSLKSHRHQNLSYHEQFDHHAVRSTGHRQIDARLFRSQAVAASTSTAERNVRRAARIPCAFIPGPMLPTWRKADIAPYRHHRLDTVGRALEFLAAI
jgi:hypothetical protein